MSNNRDNFTQKTIALAASRVGYRCSFPGCTSATIGASMESSESVSKNGVGAHICAAAEGGPRYDKDMTKEERRSVENCIWLCQTHAHLIDTDVNTFPAKLLRQWKSDAEKNSSLALADINYFNKYYNSNGDNLYEAECIFKGLIIDGNFETLSILLSQYDSSLSDVYNEFVLRYKLIYDLFCNRNDLNEDLLKYQTLNIKTGADQLISYFIKFLMSEKLKLLVSFASDPELRKIAQLVIDGNLINSIIQPHDNPTPFIIKKEHEKLLYSTITYMAFKERYYNLSNEDKEHIVIDNEELYFDIIHKVYIAGRKSIILSSDNSKELDFIKLNFNKINQLDIRLQIPIFEQLLYISMENSDDYNLIYSYCPQEAKMDNSIIAINNVYNVIYNFNDVSEEELIKTSLETKNYLALLEYIEKLSSQKQESFLDENQFLYTKDSLFIYQKHLLTQDDSTIRNLIDRYKDMYEEDFLFHCIIALRCIENAENELSWLKNHWDMIQNKHINPYFTALDKYKKYDDLYQFSLNVRDASIKFRIACCLQNSSENKHKEQCKSIYLELISINYIQNGLYHNLAVVQWNLGEVENALENFQKEYNLYPSSQSLKNILYLRQQTERFIDDFYLNEAKMSNNGEIQGFVGLTLMHLNRKEEARFHFLRSLLISENNPPCLFGIFKCCNDIDFEEPEIVDVNTVCELSCESELIRVAIHEEKILENITPNSFADCMHYSEYDDDTSALMYSKKGDTVTVFGKSYLIVKITYLYDYIRSVAFKDFANHPSTQRIESSNSEEFIEKIKDILSEEQEKAKDIVDNYNNTEIRLPFTYLAKILGKSKLNTFEFLLFGNSERIRNNTNDFEGLSENTTYILSYDSIATLAHLDMLKDIDDISYTCPIQVKEQLLSDINSEISDIRSKRQVGYMAYCDDGLSMIAYNQQTRQERFRFLIKIKTFLDRITCEKDSDFKGEKIDFSELVAQHQFFCENSCLGKLQNTEKGVLVSDDQFLCAIASLEELPAVGICHIITKCNYTWSEMLEKIKALAKMKFLNYLPTQIYLKIADLIYKDKDNYKVGKNELINWLLCDLGKNSTSDHHRKVIIQLVRDLADIIPEIKFYKNILNEIAVHHYAALYPEEIKRIMNNTFNELKNVSFEIKVED